MGSFKAIILAAGKGTRMKSATPKVLHKICGKTILDYVLDVTSALRSLKTYVVVGHGAEKVRGLLGEAVTFVRQDRLLGTADAVNRCAPYLKNFRGTVLVLCGDTPLLSKEIVAALLKQHGRTGASATVLTAKLDDPRGYGRIVRDAQGAIKAIREQKDASGMEDKIKEINAGAYCFDAKDLFQVLKEVRKSRQKEFYLTDIVELLLAGNKKVGTVTAKDMTAAFGVNTRQDLAQAQAVIRQRILNAHMARGVTVVDPLTTFIEAGVAIGRDTVIHPMTVIHTDVRIGKNCSIGPMARLRPGTRISDGVEIGNFAEVSRATLGSGVFQKHFSFLGDAAVGAGANIGAGVVTANFDGKNKNRTLIGAKAFVGSDAILVAPTRIGAGAVIGAGSVLPKGRSVPAGKVAVGVPARVIKGAL
ncbi:MAG: NTP transferase domain-containing protein [Candidatus Omnitrophica bacterium]|nr:NTP transferase domain-containing protein [Candidatus Omnitrophota bacterium]